MMPRLLIIYYICFLALVSTICADKLGSDEEIERGDGYIDKLLQDMFQNRVEEYDPYVIEDSVIEIHRKVLFVNFTGEAKLYDGQITGLSTLHRSEHCSLQEEGDRLKVKAELGAGELKFHYKGSVKFMNFGPTITVHGNLAYVAVHMEFTVDSKTGRNGSLDKFIIDDMRGMEVWITGLGPVNWAVNTLISGVTKIFKRFVRNFLENKVEKHIAERIPNFQFPVEGGEDTEAPVTNEPETTATKSTTPTEPETTPPTEETTPTEPETTPPTEETTPTEPETTPPTEETTPTEPETTPPTEETTPTEPETTPPTEETSPTEPETTTPTEETSPTEPETNPPTEPEETDPPEEPEELQTNPPEEPEVNPPEIDIASEEVEALEPEDGFSSSSEEPSDMSAEGNLEVEGQYDPEKYLSFIEE